MKNRTIGIFAAIVIALLGVFYLGSPYYAVNVLKNAAQSGDVDALETGVDFPSVQNSLKAQMTIALTTQLQNDPQMRNNPFAGLGAVMMPAIIDKAVTAYVTPEGIAALVKGAKPGEIAKSAEKSDIEYKTEYSSLNRFRVHTSKKDSNEEGPTFLFERRGWFSWTMIKVELPQAFLDRKKGAKPQ